MIRREALLSWLCLFLFAGLVGAFMSAWCAPVHWADEWVARDLATGAMIPD